MTALPIASLRVAAFAAGSLLASGAMAQMGGMGAGGMDMAPHLSGEPLQLNRDQLGPQRPELGTYTSTSALSDGNVEGSLGQALAKGGVTVPGGDLKAACAGFKTLGPCVAALHVAQNLNPPGGFDALKGLTTGHNAMKLGKAIQQLQPTSDGAAEEKKANHQARSDLDAAQAALPRG
jgi:hypothetical protein